MKRLLIVLALLGVFVVLSRLNRKSLHRKFPFLKRIDMTLAIVAYTMLAAYCLAFLYWFFTEVL